MAIRICKLELDERRKQIFAAGTSMFPIAAYYNDLDQMPAKEVPWHWHGELEVIYVAKGEIILGIQQDECILKEEEGVFINANVLHSVRKSSQECIIYSFVFAASLISGSADGVIEQRFVKPLLAASRLPCVKFLHEHPWQREGAHCILNAFQHYEEGSYGFEFLVREQLSHMWFLIVTHCLQVELAQEETETTDIMRLKTMMEFIHSHFPTNLTLSDIASSANISEREALRCFQKTIRDSPISYLLKFRISQAVDYLIHTEHSITEISALCGFEDTSYFSKMFKRHIQETPRNYRKHREYAKQE